MYLLIPLSKQQAICIDMVLKRKKKIIQTHRNLLCASRCTNYTPEFENRMRVGYWKTQSRLLPTLTLEAHNEINRTRSAPHRVHIDFEEHSSWRRITSQSLTYTYKWRAWGQWSERVNWLINQRENAMTWPVPLISKMWIRKQSCIEHQQKTLEIHDRYCSANFHELHSLEINGVNEKSQLYP